MISNKLLAKEVLFYFVLFCFISCKSHKIVSSFELNNVTVDSINIEYFNSHLYLKTDIENRKVNLILDTAADGLYLDSVFIAKSGLKFGDLAYGKIRGAGINEERIRIIKDSVFCKINSLNLKFNFTPILQLRPIVGKKIDGIIGNIAFRNKSIYIDYLNQKIFVFKNFNAEMVKDFKKISITEINNRYFVNASITITKDIVANGKYLIDLGSGGVVSITNNVAMQNNLKNKIANQIICNSSNAGIGGYSSDAFFQSNAITVGDLIVKNEHLSYSNNKTGALSEANYLGLLGNGFFERFYVVLDFENKYLYLKPNINFKKKPKTNNLGFGYIDRTDIFNGLIVTSLFENSEIERKGLKLGDIITHINNINVKNIKDFTFLDKAKNKRKIKLKFDRNGISQEINFITNNLFKYVNN